MKKLEIIKNHLIDLKEPNIIELGVKSGNSTKMFLDLCNKNNGFLTSIDIIDYSNVSKDKRWNFILSSDDNFDYINKKICNQKFDVLFIDSLHEPEHVKKVFYFYFNYIKLGGFIFVDDVVWLPYIEGSKKDNDFVERINRLTFEKILEIFNSNPENITLNIDYEGTGLATLKKIGEKLNPADKIKNRMFTLKNLIKKYIYSPKPKN